MIAVNLNKAKLIGHDIRRQERAKEFAPLDEVIMKQIPGNNIAEVEEKRQAIRDKYAAMQNAIELSVTPDEIKSAIGMNQ